MSNPRGAISGLFLGTALVLSMQVQSAEHIFMPEQLTKQPLIKKMGTMDVDWGDPRYADGGYVDLEFVVMPDGRAVDARVVDSRPGDVFVRQAMELLNSSRWYPGMRDGHPVAVHMNHKFVMQPDNINFPTPGKSEAIVSEQRDDNHLIFSIEPKYPPQAMEKQIEGYVDLEFTVTTKGRVEDVKILESDPPGIFDAAAEDAVKQWRFKPFSKDGKVASTKVKQRIEFQLNN